MRAYLDDVPLELGGQTLTDAVVAGKRAADEQGRMIIEVWADGEPAPEADLSEPPDFVPYASEVRFVSVEPAGLVRAAMEEAAVNLEQIRQPQKDAAAALARGETAAAMGHVSVALQAWESVRRAVQDGSSALGVSPAGLLSSPDAEEVCATAIDDLLSALQEVQRAIKAQDVATLADTLEYDLDDLAETWSGLLTEMAGGLASARVEE